MLLKRQVRLNRRFFPSISQTSCNLRLITVFSSSFPSHSLSHLAAACPPGCSRLFLPSSVSLLGGQKAPVNSLCVSGWHLDPQRQSPCLRTHTRVRTQHKNEQSRRVGSERETRASDNNLELNLWPVNRSEPRPRRRPLASCSRVTEGPSLVVVHLVALHSDKRRSDAQD